MAESKKEWHRPELIVLVQGKPEEMVLQTCKMISGTADSYRDGTGYYCTREDPNCSTPCSSLGGT